MGLELEDLISITRPSASALWCYLYWWLFVVFWYFDPSPAIWGTAGGTFIVVAVALNTNAYYAPVVTYLRNNWIAILRYCLIPFCLAAYAALAARNGTFFAIFPPDPEVLGILFGGMIILFIALQVAHHYLKKMSNKKFVEIPPPPKEIHQSNFLYFVHMFRPNIAILWGILFWWAWVVFHHPPASVKVWETGVLAAIFVGVAHNSNVYRPPMRLYVKNNPFRVTRFYMIPFFTATYGGTVGGAGFTFFPPSTAETLEGIGGAVLIVVLMIIFHMIFRKEPKLLQDDSLPLKNSVSVDDTPFLQPVDGAATRRSQDLEKIV